MKFNIVEDYGDLSRKAARIVAGQVEYDPESILGLPTGSTPLGMYDELVKFHQEEGLSFAGVTTFNLDEYIGIEPDHPGSFNHYMEENFFQHVDLDPGNAHIPDGLAEDPRQECSEYENKIAGAGGIDLQLLGIGANGHIAFIEPGSSLPFETDVVELTEQTRRANSAHFSDMSSVPEKAITMGMGTILSADKILMLINGGKKARAVEELAERKITTELPASLLHLHDDVTVLLDREAAINI